MDNFFPVLRPMICHQLLEFWTVIKMEPDQLNYFWIWSMKFDQLTIDQKKVIKNMTFLYTECPMVSVFFWNRLYLWSSLKCWHDKEWGCRPKSLCSESPSPFCHLRDAWKHKLKLSSIIFAQAWRVSRCQNVIKKVVKPHNGPSAVLVLIASGCRGCNWFLWFWNKWIPSVQLVIL